MSLKKIFIEPEISVKKHGGIYCVGVRAKIVLEGLIGVKNDCPVALEDPDAKVFALMLDRGQKFVSDGTVYYDVNWFGPYVKNVKNEIYKYVKIVEGLKRKKLTTYHQMAANAALEEYFQKYT